MGTPYDAWIAFCQGTLAVGGTFVAYLILDVLWSLATHNDSPEPIEGTGLPDGR